MAKPGYVHNLVTPAGRILYPHLASPNDDGMYPSGKYEATLIFSQEEEEGYSKLIAAAVEAAQQVVPGITAEQLDISLRDGESKTQQLYHGQWVIRAKSNQAIQCFDGARASIDVETVKHGDFGRLSVTAGFYKMSMTSQEAGIYRKGGAYILEDEGKFYRPGVTFYLNRVQKIQDNDGTISGGGGASGSEFPEEPDF